MTRPSRRLALLALAGLALTACSGDDGPLRLLTYDSFPDDPDGPIGVALQEFTDDTGIEIEIVKSSDTGTMVSSAALTAGNPEADVMWGIDNTNLSRALDSGVFEPYEAAGLDAIPPELRSLVPDFEVTPVDFGDVCVNYDIEALDDAGLAPPSGFADLARPEYAAELVVQDPGQSSPGLAFLLASVAAFGEDGWEDFWRELRANDVRVASGWTQAYYEDFSRSGGDRALVVSYGSSPPYEVIGSADPAAEPGSAVVESTCFRQVEFAGVLRGTDREDDAEALVDFLISERFQREVAEGVFVFPANADVELDPAFVEFATIPTSPIVLDPALIEANRTEWIERWNSVVLR